MLPCFYFLKISIKTYRMKKYQSIFQRPGEHNKKRSKRPNNKDPIIMELNVMDLLTKIVNNKEPIIVVGLGYVGLPIALAFGKKVKVIGFDINSKKIQAYLQGKDPTKEAGDLAVKQSPVQFTDQEQDIAGGRFYIVAVPTPLRSDKFPDLEALKAASQLVGKVMGKGAVVVYESTVYPGVTEEICGPILEEASGMKCGVDFKIAYSPERINPGDQVNRLENIVKIVSAMDSSTLEVVAKVYEMVIEVGVYRAENIKVAKAAKVIENAQRDTNIAFMNELSMIFHDMGIDTKAVLKAAGTKWNFLKFTPGLVGGHCIGIDPYYLTYKAEDIGYHSRLILAARHINDDMGKYVAQSIVKILVKLKEDIKSAQIGFLGLAYKENTNDIRNTKVTDIIQELKEYGMTTMVADPLVSKAEVKEQYGIDLVEVTRLKNLNVLVMAVPHRQFTAMGLQDFNQFYRENSIKIIIDVKGAFCREDFENMGYYYWSL